MPVRYINIPDSIVFDSELPEGIDITLRDNGYALFKYYFTKRKDSISLDVASIVNYSTNKMLQGSQFNDIIKNNLFASSELVSYTPGNISFRYTVLDQKDIPVIFDGQIFLSSGYLLDGDISVYPDTVRVYGAKNVLNSLHYAYTVNDTIENVRSSAPLTYPIKKIYNVKFIPDKVSVIIPVDKYTQKDVNVPITCINVPEGINVRFFPSTVKVSFLIGISKYDNVTADDFDIEFDYNELKRMTEPVVALRILSSPDFVQNLALNPSEAEFIFEKK